MRFAIVRVVLGASVLCLTWGCAPYTEQERYAHEDRLNQARDQYVVKKERCEQLGGAMMLRAKRLEEPGYHDYRLAKCVKR